MGRSSGRDVEAVLEVCPSERSTELVDKFGALGELLEAVPGVVCFRAPSVLGADFISVREGDPFGCAIEAMTVGVPYQVEPLAHPNPNPSASAPATAKQTTYTGPALGLKRCNASA